MTALKFIPLIVTLVSATSLALTAELNDKRSSVAIGNTQTKQPSPSIWEHIRPVSFQSETINCSHEHFLSNPEAACEKNSHFCKQPFKTNRYFEVGCGVRVDEHTVLVGLQNGTSCRYLLKGNEDGQCTDQQSQEMDVKRMDILFAKNNLTCFGLYYVNRPKCRI